MSAIETIALAAAGAVAVGKSKSAKLVSSVQNTLLAGENLARGAGIAGRNIHHRVAGEEVSRAEEKHHRLGRHDGEVLGGREVGHAKGVPEDNVGVVDGGGAVTNPLGDAAGWLARGLGDVFSRGPELVVAVLGDVDGMSGKGGALPDQGALLGHEAGDLSADQLVADGLLAVGVELVGVGNLPGAGGGAVVVRHGLALGHELGALVIETVAVKVLGAADGGLAGDGVVDEDGVVGTVDVGVDAEAEEMLVVVGVDAGVDLSAPALGVLVLEHGVGVQDTGELDLRGNGAILVEHPGDDVLVVGGGEDLLDDQLAATGDDDGIVTEVAMLEEDAGILLVNADGILDGAKTTITGRELGIHVVNGALAVAAKGQAVGHVASTILTLVKSVLAVVGGLGVTVWDDHFGERKSVEDGADGALVVEGDVVEHDAFSVVEADVELPVLPLNLPAGKLERNTFGLGDVDGLQIGAVTTTGLHRSRMIVHRRGLAEWAADLGDIDGNDLTLVGIVDRAEVKRVLVLAVVDVWTVVHECLLQPHLVAKPLIVANGPWVAIDLVHVLWGNTADDALFNDLGVLADDVLYQLELLHGDLAFRLVARSGNITLG